MSGGSLSYLYNKQFPEVCNYIDEMKKVEKELISQGYTDIARDVRRLIEYCLTAENRISVLFDNLSDVFHAVEWYYSSDYGENTLIEELDRYRAGQFKTDAEVFDEYRNGKDVQANSDSGEPAKMILEAQLVYVENEGESFPQFKNRLLDMAVKCQHDIRGNFCGTKVNAVYNRESNTAAIVRLYNKESLRF